MWVFFILVVLCLGYLKSTSTPFGRATLRRSQGWEAYAHLAKNGLGLLAQGILLTAVLFFLSLVYAFFWSIASWIFSWDDSPYRAVVKIYSYDLYRGIKLYELLAVVLSYFYHIGTLRQGKDDWKETFRSQNAVLNMIIGATESQSPLRVSLKSRKVYIGIVESERFTNSDLDNVTLIPYLSGHRDKDTLQMVVDHNYFDVYHKNEIADDLTSLSLFRVVIRMDEVESMSLFDIAYFADFQETED